MSWLVEARHAVAAALLEALDPLGVAVLEFEPRGDAVGGTWVTVRIAAVSGEDVTIEITAVDDLASDRASQDDLDVLVDLIDVAVPPGVFLRDWRIDFDDLTGAVKGVGTYTAARYAGWCDPSPTAYTFTPAAT